MYLGVDGGGTKTAFAIVNDAGELVAEFTGSGTYHPEVGLDGVRDVLTTGVPAVLARAGLSAADLRHAFFGLPTFGEDKAADATLRALPGLLLGPDRYSVGNDMVCSWAGALACADGVSVIAGTGSIAYGEYAGRHARAGGWGELFGDEGSGFWIAREGLVAFARMADGRAPSGPLREHVRRHYGLADDLDLAGLISGLSAGERSSLAALAPLVADAARAGDGAARAVFRRAADELADLVRAVRQQLGVPPGVTVPVSYTGGVFETGGLVLEPFAEALGRAGGLELKPPRLKPVYGAALYAARAVGVHLKPDALPGAGRVNS